MATLGAQFVCRETGTCLALSSRRSGIAARWEDNVNWDRIEGNWKQMKGKVRQQWGKLTDDDFDQIGGKKDELVGKLQERMGIARDQAEREVQEWSRNLDT